MKRTKLTPRFDFTPVSDLMFQMLLFFILTSSFMVESGLKINLPKSRLKEIKPGEKIVLEITNNQNIFLNKKQIPLENLEEELKFVLSLSPDKTLILKADKSLSYGFVIKIIDITKFAGVTKLAIATEPYSR